MGMNITRRSPIDGETYTMYMEITKEQVARWQDGELIQTVFYFLSPDEREFLISGITPNQWKDLFGQPDPRDDYRDDYWERDEIDEDDDDEDLRD